MQPSFFTNSRYVTELTSRDFKDNPTNLKSDKCSAVLFYCAWCGHCQNFKNDWEKIAETSTFIKIYALDCEKNKEHLNKIKEQDPEFIQGYPTIYFYHKGKPFKYENSRSYDKLLKTLMGFCEKRQ